jgi:hypothetical protein
MQGQIKRFSRDQAQWLDTVLHLVDYSLHVELVVGAELPNEGDIDARNGPNPIKMAVSSWNTRRRRGW